MFLVTGRVRKGVGSSCWFLMTRTVPPNWVTNSRPSGANSIDVGPTTPATKVVSWNPGGSSVGTVRSSNRSRFTRARGVAERAGTGGLLFQNDFSHFQSMIPLLYVNAKILHLIVLFLPREGKIPVPISQLAGGLE